MIFKTAIDCDYYQYIIDNIECLKIKSRVGVNCCVITQLFENSTGISNVWMCGIPDSESLSAVLITTGYYIP